MTGFRLTGAAWVAAVILMALGWGLCAFAQEPEGDAEEPGQAFAPEPAAEMVVEGGFEETQAPEVALFEEGASPTEENDDPGGIPVNGETAANGEEPPAGQPAYWGEIVKGLEQQEPPATGPDTEADVAEGASAKKVSPGVSYAKAISTLCLVLGGILVLLYAVRRVGKGTRLFAASNLATVLGRVYLDPRSSLHFVRVGHKILVVGVTRNGIAPVAELEDDLLEPGAPAASPEPSAKERPNRFAAYLRERSASMTARSAGQGAGRDATRDSGRDFGRETAREEEFDDSEILSLRDDIQRLQRTLREPTSETDGE